MKKTVCLFLSCLMALAFFAGCADKTPPDDTPGEEYEYYAYDAPHTSEDRLLWFYSSDSGLDSFLNDYRERHMRYSDNRIHSHPVGAGSTAWKEWESMIGGWWDASAENGTIDSFYATKDLVSSWLVSPRQDRQGYIWADEGNDIASWGMGWAFPDYTLGGTGWLFDTEDNTEGWTAENASLSVSGSVLTAASSGQVNSIELISPAFECNTLISPFLRMGLGFSASGEVAVDDLYVYYQTENNSSWSESRKVSFSQFCTTGFQIDSSFDSQGFFFPMYLQDEWGSDSRTRITRIKLVLAAEEGSTFSGSLNLDYLCTEYDDRQPLNPCNYILAAKNIVEFSQDEALLAEIMPHARAAMNFLLNQLQGDEGLIDTGYLVGHFNDGLKGVGTGLGNGYWDVLAFPQINLYCNISYYNALVAMSYLENMCGHYGVETQDVTTANDDMSGTYRYAETAESLAQLAETCKTRMQEEFWNEQTGRFHAGVREFYNDIQDHGYLMFNQQVLASGIAAEEQAESVLAWINGERTVAGDQSTGEDIYYYEFAPRFNTAEIGSDFYWAYSASFNGNVQNGGTALHLAYYDLVSQAMLNKNKSFDRLKTIQAWYEKVKAAGGTGWDFYHAYYDNTNIGIQGGTSSGTIGVDYEFLEAALLLTAVPDAYFGLDTRYDGTLIVSPALPGALDYWRMENLTFGKYYYDLSIGQYFVQCSAVSEYTAGSGLENAKLEIRMNEPSFQYKIFLNGEETQDYRVEGGKIVLQTEFGNVKAEIKPA